MIFIAVCYVSTNHDLIHAFGGNDLQDGGDSFEGFLAGLALILEGKAQSGLAVADSADVFCSSNTSKNLNS